jgi:hypothetical protein
MVIIPERGTCRATYTTSSSSHFNNSTATCAHSAYWPDQDVFGSDYGLYPNNQSVVITASSYPVPDAKADDVYVPSDMDLFLKKLFPKPVLRQKAISQTYKRPIRKQFTSMFFPVIIKSRGRL